MVPTNACTIFYLNHNEFPPKNYFTSFDFSWNLTESLILSFIRVRIIISFQKQTNLKIAIVFRKSAKQRNHNRNPLRRLRSYVFKLQLGKEIKLEGQPNDNRNHLQ